MVSGRMTQSERRSTTSLGSIFALRMLGLFVVAPVLSVEVSHYPGGDNSILVGLALGIYGLTQGLLQIPFGFLSDRIGRKLVIVFGLLVFAAGSFIAAIPGSLALLIAGRALQGAGAVSAMVSALLADQTREEVRTKAMAVMGASISLVFGLSLVLAPPLTARIGLAGVFILIGVLAMSAVVIVAYVTPDEANSSQQDRSPFSGAVFSRVLRNANLLRLYFGVFVLHAIQLAMWVAVPSLLVHAGVNQGHHWHVYLPAVLGSFVIMGATLFRLERRGYLRAAFLSSIGLIALTQAGLASASETHAAPPVLATLLLLFFCGFNVLTATQPSLVSRLAPVEVRGLALGVYNTAQSFGFFAGGILGGAVASMLGPDGLFAACGISSAVWLGVAWSMRTPV